MADSRLGNQARTMRESNAMGEGLDALVSFLEHEPVPAIVLDPDYNILAANAAYERQFAAARDGHVGRKCHQVSHHYALPCDQMGEHCPMQRARESRAPDRVLHIHHTPRGAEHVDVELRPIIARDGRLIAFVEKLHTLRSASAEPGDGRLVGRAPAFLAALAAVERVAPSELPVLLLGESGAGKELFARAIHATSPRAQGPFVVVECSGFAETLFESELFGYEKGAFTGATSRKPGLVETADGGTLFLDELGDVPLSMQVKLLRLIESGSYRRVGSVETRQANFRLIAATHKPLREMVARGEFRQDLYYRLSAFPIHLPALRERREDLPLLAATLLGQADARAPRCSLTPAALARLEQHDWPGNIRELRNVLERARLYADDGVIRPEHLPDYLGLAAQSGGGVPLAAAVAGLNDAALRKLVGEFRGTRRELAAQLGLSERTLYRRLKALGLS